MTILVLRLTFAVLVISSVMKCSIALRSLRVFGECLLLSSAQTRIR